MVVGAYNDQFSVFYFNLHAEVGPGKPNRIDDVELVRFGIKVLASGERARAAGAAASAFVAAAAQVSFLGPYDATIGAAVLAFQRWKGLTQDSTISKIMGAYTPHNRIYVLQYMQGEMRRTYPNLYPRIDRVAEVGPTVSAVIRNMFVLDN